MRRGESCVFFDIVFFGNGERDGKFGKSSYGKENLIVNGEGGICC